jgi:hypothetical protein
LSSRITSFINTSTVSLFPLIIFSFAKNCSINNFHKNMSKNNVENKSPIYNFFLEWTNQIILVNKRFFKKWNNVFYKQWGLRCREKIKKSFFSLSSWYKIFKSYYFF